MTWTWLCIIGVLIFCSLGIFTFVGLWRCRYEYKHGHTKEVAMANKILNIVGTVFIVGVICWFWIFWSACE